MAKPIFISEEYGSISRTEFRRLKVSEKADLMEAWFRERFEPPENETPRWDGEFHFLWGGPFDPQEQLSEAFDGLVNTKIIEALAAKFWDQAGDEWAPTPKYQDRGEEDLSGGANQPFTELGSPEEIELRASILQRLEAIENILAQKPEPPSLIGHNHPPESIDEIGDPELEQLAVALETIKTELSKQTPRPPDVAPPQEVVLGFSVKLRNALSRKLDIATDEFAKEIGKKAAQAPFWYGLYEAVHNFLPPLTHWIQGFMPF